METRVSQHSRGPLSRAPAGSARIALLLSVLPVLLAGCAAPGEPLERKPPVPATVSDLSAAQSANEVVLTFTLPNETVDRRPLKNPPAVEIYRDVAPASPSSGAVIPAAPSSPALLVTIPSDVASRYSDHGRFRYADSLQAAEFLVPSGNLVRYIVRTRASQKKESLDSNAASLAVYPAAEPIDGVKAEVTHDGIRLTWMPPRSWPGGSAPPVTGYNIYRAESESESVSAPSAAANPGNPQLKSPLVKIGESATTDYRDAQAELGNTYVYSVRSVAQYADRSIESADSQLAVVLARDTFPPAAPQGLVVVLVPAQGNVPAHLELSWAINAETDLAGYNVYRSGAAGAPGQRLNAAVLATPAFRDLDALPGQPYIYSVTAVDRSGNESAPGTAVSGVIPVGTPGP
jgi:hypothetical protein